MGMKKVVILHENKYTTEEIRAELLAEAFPYLFKIASEVDPRDLEEFIKDSDEVWTFGYVGNQLGFQFTCEHGVEVWVMA